MAVILNKWIEKQKKKKEHQTAAAYESNSIDSWIPVKPDVQIKRHGVASRASLVRTLRGVRK